MSIEAAIGILEEMYGAFTADDTVADSELDDAPIRMWFEIPPALRALYRRTGRSRALHQSGNRLVPLAELNLRGDHLVFYEEAQGVCHWGIALSSLGLDDPPVDASERGPFGQTLWVREFSSVSEFLLVQGAWQALEGGLPFVGLMIDDRIAGGAREPERAVLDARVRETATREGTLIIDTPTTKVWRLYGAFLVAMSETHFGLAARDAELFAEASKQLGVALDDWDYESSRDGL